MYYIFNINIVKHHRYWKVQSTSFQSVQTEACLLKTTAVLSAAKPYHSVSLLIWLQYTRCSDFEAVGFRMLNVLYASIQKFNWYIKSLKYVSTPQIFVVFFLSVK